MKTISFSNQQVEFLIEQYESELVLAKEYVDQIVEILNKLGVNAKAPKENTVEKEPRQYKKRGRKPTVKVAEPKIPAKRGRKKKVVAVPTPIESAPVPAAKPERKTKKTKKVKEAKKATKKPAAAKKESAKGAAAIKAILNPETAPAPKKEAKKVAKKKPASKRKAPAKKVAKPQPKKQTPVAEPAPVVETIAVPAEAPKE